MNNILVSNKNYKFKVISSEKSQKTIISIN